MRRRIETFNKTERRKKRVREKVKEAMGSKPRVVVFRSNKYIYAQVVDREGKVLSSYSSLNLRKDEGKKIGTKMEEAFEVGKRLGEKIKSKIKEVVFDRGAYKFHGRVKNLCEGLRKAGIKV